MSDDFNKDIAAVSRIASVPTILDVVCRLTGLGFAAVARVTEDRWIACSVKDDIAFGLKPGGELKIETTICNEIRQSGGAVVIDQVSSEPHWRQHPTPRMYGFESYISMPIIRADGSFFGTLCAIDPRPARLNTPEIIGSFKLFAELIAIHLDAEQQLAATQESLATEKEEAALREQFIAVLGHDLRNPLGAIDAGVQLLSRTVTDARSVQVLGMMRASVSRMAGLVGNVLDLARGRLKGGLPLNREPTDLSPVVTQVVNELRAASPDRQIELVADFRGEVNVDGSRVGQLLSNLAANALTHGADGAPVRVEATTQGGTLELSVANAGSPIDPKVQQRLFRPFFRGEQRGEGLGLGLYIASEIARAHGGALEVASDAQETRFTFRMPGKAPA